MRFNPIKLRLWLPLLAGVCAAVFLVCCNQVIGQTVPPASHPIIATAPADTAPTASSAQAETSTAVSSSPVTNATPVLASLAPKAIEIPAAPRHRRHHHSRRESSDADTTPAASSARAETSAAVSDSTTPRDSALTSVPAVHDSAAAKDSLAAPEPAMPAADAKDGTELTTPQTSDEALPANPEGNSTGTTEAPRTSLLMH